MLNGAPYDGPVLAVHHCTRLGEIQACLVHIACPAKQRVLEAELAEALASLETGNATALLLRQPHV